MHSNIHIHSCNKFYYCVSISFLGTSACILSLYSNIIVMNKSKPFYQKNNHVNELLIQTSLVDIACYFARPYPKEMTLDILFIYHLKQIRVYILWESTEKGKETELMLGMLYLFSTEFN